MLTAVLIGLCLAVFLAASGLAVCLMVPGRTEPGLTAWARAAVAGFTLPRWRRRQPKGRHHRPVLAGGGR